MSRIGRAPIPVPAASRSRSSRSSSAVSGPPRGSCRSGSRSTSDVTRDSDQLVVTAPTTAASTVRCTARAHLVAKHGDRRHRRLEKRLRSRASLPRAAEGPRPWSCARLLAPGQRESRRTASIRGPAPTRVVAGRGHLKQRVGEMAAYIRKQRPPEPQGQGHPLRGRGRHQEVGKRHDQSSPRKRPACAAAAACAPRFRAPRSGRGSPCSVKSRHLRAS